MNNLQINSSSIELRYLIQTRLNSDLRIHDREGNLQNSDDVKNEYSRIRQYLLDHHLSDEGNVVIKLAKDYHYLLTMLACMEIGLSYIPLSESIPNDRLKQIGEETPFKLVIDESKLREILNYTGRKIAELPALDPDQVLYVIFTSGSTGKPKGVSIRRKSLENFFIYLRDYYPGVSEKDHLLQVTEFTFDISLIDVGIFLLRNTAVFFTHFENNIFRLAHEIESYQISFINTVPNNLNMLLNDALVDRVNYGSLRHLLIGGGRFSYGLYQKCQKRLNSDVNIYNLYGPTEATVYCIGLKLNLDEQKECLDHVVSIGEPFPNVKALIVSDEGKVLSSGEKGELYLGGVQLFKDYVNQPEITEKVMIQLDGESYYRSGDLAFVDGGGRFYIVGRLDDTIKHRGYRINLQDVDSYITRLSYVQDAVTIAIPDEISENQTISFIILNAQKTVNEIRQDLKNLLLDYQIPEKIVFIDKYPTNSSGKVDRKVLREQYLASAEKP